MADDSQSVENNKPGIEIGGWVDIEGMITPGRVLSIDTRRKTAVISIANQEWTIKLNKLSPGDGPLVDERFEPPRLTFNSSKLPPIYETDLHGMTVDEALKVVDESLDRAYMGGQRSFRIITGHGTGKLRSAVGTFLTKHPLVAHFRFGSPLEGGVASTIVELKDRRR